MLFDPSLEGVKVRVYGQLKVGSIKMTCPEVRSGIIRVCALLHGMVGDVHLGLVQWHNDGV